MHRRIWRGGGGLPAHDPLQDPILLFSHTFSLKSAHVGGQNPPQNGSTPPLTENPGSGPDMYQNPKFRDLGCQIIAKKKKL